MKQRYIILDALRGFALFGISLANFPEFSLYTFQPAEVQAAMPSATADSVCRALLLFLVDGKFYTIFSLLFGIGFSIILSNEKERGVSGHKIFYRRMIGLAIIGLLHLLFLWTSYSYTPWLECFYQCFSVCPTSGCYAGRRSCCCFRL